MQMKGGSQHLAVMVRLCERGKILIFMSAELKYPKRKKLWINISLQNKLKYVLKLELYLYSVHSGSWAAVTL
jgi:hypothetical protein